MGSHSSHHADECHIEYAESDAHHGGQPHYRIPPTTKGKSLMCVAGYAWSPQYDRVKAIVDALTHQYPDKYEAWFFETNYMHSCIPWHCKELGKDEPELFDRLPLCWIQNDDGSNKMIGGRNSLAKWVLKTERNSKAAMEAVFLEISDGLRHASPSIALRNAQGDKDTDKKDTDLLKESEDESEEEKAAEEKDEPKEEEASSMPDIYRKMLALISAPKQPSNKPSDAAPVEEDDDQLKEEPSEAEPKPAVVAPPPARTSAPPSPSSSSSSSPRETALKPQDNGEEKEEREEGEEEDGLSNFELPRRPSEDALTKDEKPLSSKAQRKEQRRIAREKRAAIKEALKEAQKKKVAVKTTEEMIRECEERLSKEYPELDHKDAKKAHH